MNDKALTLGLLSAGLLLAGLITQNGTLALMALPLLVYLGFGILESPAAERIRLIAERSLHVSQAGEGAAVEVCVAVRNTGAPVSLLRLSDEPQPGALIMEGALRHCTALASGGETSLTYTLRAARGGFQWSAVHAAVSDPFGLFETRLDLPSAAEALVQPRVKKFRDFPLRPQSTLHSPGSIPARTGGTGTDFWGVREYHAGDPMRRLDWRRTARHPRQFFTKEFEQEEIADIGIILDARQSNDIKSGGDSLFEHALGATASLVELFLRRGNRVSFLMPGDEMTIVYPGYGKVQLNRILHSLARARPGSKQGHVSLDHVPLRLFESRALVVIVSPLAASDLQVFRRLRARGNQALLISPDPISFGRTGFPQDPAGRLAARLARVERRLELRSIAQLGVRVIDWDVDTPLAPLVRDALGAARARHR
jgi:uncharacterized protein (DUF58 family)